jgi:hypothetical protein
MYIYIYINDSNMAYDLIKRRIIINIYKNHNLCVTCFDHLIKVIHATGLQRDLGSRALSLAFL